MSGIDVIKAFSDSSAEAKEVSQRYEPVDTTLDGAFVETKLPGDCPDARPGVFVVSLTPDKVLEDLLVVTCEVRGQQDT